MVKNTHTHTYIYIYIEIIHIILHQRFSTYIYINYKVAPGVISALQ